ncbi:pyridoxamine 5'-phosphate oxidase family protein [Nocardia cyriacigeorgica]|uniref:pyridoxamine 5'-phosphate oxidase family protein n=1 Tax=Nocardia cyriacigeorgica TaxID=135487 RepID=UPI00245389E2|nr:pyridoxamine 5'-phosphate oxidase family protein [Nocardia cyriacigeorgica]
MSDSIIADDASRRVVELEREHALSLLATAPFGRVVYTRDALPAIRPVNHIVDSGVVVVRTRLTSEFSAAVHSFPIMVVAYQADDIDVVGRTGWSVVVTGTARPVTDRDRLARYHELLQPWVGLSMDDVIEIEPTLVNGIQLVDPEGIRSSQVGSEVPGEDRELDQH